MAAPSKTTILSAVNEMLRAADENIITVTGAATSAHAEALLDNVIMDTLLLGWTFNMRGDGDTPVTLTPDGSNNIVLASNIIYIDSAGKDSHLRLAEVGGKLYDVDRNSDSFTNDVEVMYLISMDFEDLPEVARRYITNRAVREYSYNRTRDTRLLRMYTQEENRSFGQLQRRFVQTKNASLRTKSEAARKIHINRNRNLRY